MKLYCKGSIVLAWHDDDQNVPTSAYGDDVTVIQATSWTDIPEGLITHFDQADSLPKES